MSSLEIIILAIALSIDACVVSFSYGLKFSQNRMRNSLLLACTTGIFQGLMPPVGYFLTGFVKSYIEPYANLIVFLIFTYLGVKIIIESFQNAEEKPLCIDLKCLILAGIATSIDAFSAGITLSLSANRILKPALLIAFITFVNSLFGYQIGAKSKHAPTQWMEVFAGMLLIILGIKGLI